MGASTAIQPWPGLRQSRWDAVLVGLALLHCVALLSFPVMPVIALGLWWNANTISHCFVHRPFFGTRRANALFALYESALLGILQSLWRERHLAHHAGRQWRLRITTPLAVETLLVLTLWTGLCLAVPAFFLRVYFPGYALGLGLCFLQGHYEHGRGAATSHYGRLYNLLFFNDGYHVEHHEQPGTHWSQLPLIVATGAPSSRWPAVLRWLDALSLESLERCVLRSKRLQRFVLQWHERAFRALLPKLGAVRRVAIVGGGLFPRTALILERLLPQARLTVIEASGENIRTAHGFVNGNIEFIHDRYDPERHTGYDLVVVPLSLARRSALYRQPPAEAVLVHDWLWRRHGASVIVSLWLLKRLNLVQR